MNELQRKHTFNGKTGLISNVHKSFPFHMCADSNPREHLCCHHWHLPAITTSIKTGEILCSLPITIALLLDRNWPLHQITGSGPEVESYFLFAQGTQIGCQPSVVQNHHPPFLIHLPLGGRRGHWTYPCVYVTPNIWLNEAVSWDVLWMSKDTQENVDA